MEFYSNIKYNSFEMCAQVPNNAKIINGIVP